MSRFLSFVSHAFIRQFFSIHQNQVMTTVVEYIYIVFTPPVHYKKGFSFYLPAPPNSFYLHGPLFALA